MLYGIYNAGKSTLLNALLGQNKADVSDRPETSAITEYAWQSYRIFDTPGVDAPIEHQQITEQHLQHVEVVLFVMSTNGAFDESDIYRRLAAVLKNGQRQNWHERSKQTRHIATGEPTFKPTTR